MRGEAVITCMGMVRGTARVNEDSHISTKEIEDAIGRLKISLYTRVHGVISKIIKYGGKIIRRWVIKVCKLA